MDQTALLVRKEDLQELLEKLTKDEESIVANLKVLLPYATHETIRKTLEKRLTKGKELLKALHQGFIPVDPGFYTRTDTKDKWSKSEVKAVLKAMPLEVKEVWEKVEKMGLFKSFSITTGGGDPVLVGNLGGRHFFIAGWLNLTGKISFGIKMRI